MSALEIQAETHAETMRENRAIIAECLAAREAASRAIAASRAEVIEIGAATRATCLASRKTMAAADEACHGMSRMNR